MHRAFIYCLGTVAPFVAAAEIATPLTQCAEYLATVTDEAQARVAGAYTEDLAKLLNQACLVVEDDTSHEAYQRELKRLAEAQYYQVADLRLLLAFYSEELQQAREEKQRIADIAAAAPEGFVLPPTRDEINHAQAQGVARILLLRSARLWQEKQRLSPSSTAYLVAEAKKASAPAPLITLLEMEQENLSSQQRFACRKAWEQLFYAYGIEGELVHSFPHMVGIPTAELNKLLADEKLPLSSLFFAIGNISPKVLNADIIDINADHYLTSLGKIKERLAGITNKEEAQAQLLPLLDEIKNSNRLNYFGLILDEKLAIATRDKYGPQFSRANAELKEERKRLYAADYYGCAGLRALDFLIF